MGPSHCLAYGCGWAALTTGCQATRRQSARSILLTINFMEIRQVQDTDGPLLRELHVRMYADSPDAFSESLESARAMTDEQWIARVRQLSEPGEAVAFVAMEGTEAIGFIAGSVGRWRDGAMRPDRRDTVTLAKAWIDPRFRGRGFGRALAEAVGAWARAQGAVTLEAQVTEANEPASRFYACLGFVDMGRREPLLSNPALQIRFLRRSL